MARVNRQKATGAKIDELNALAWELRYTDYKRGLELSEEAYRLAVEFGDGRRLAYSLRNQSFCQYRLSLYEDALASAQEALELFTALGDKRGLESTQSTLGSIHVMTGQLVQGLQHFYVMQELCKELGDKEREVSALNNIGAVHFYLSDYTNALAYHLRAATLLETLQDDLGRSRSLNNIGLTLHKSGNHEEALEYLYKSLTLLEVLQDKHAFAVTLDNLGLVHGALHRFEQALEYHRQSLTLRKEIDDKQGVSEALGNLGAVYAGLENFEQAEHSFRQSLVLKRELGDKRSFAAVAVRLGSLLAKQRKFKAALALLEEALSTAEAANVKESVYGAHLALSEAYKQKRQLGKALAHHEQYCRIKEEVFNASSAQKFQSLRVSFETERKEREKEIYRLKNEELLRVNAELEGLTRSLQQADRERSGLLAQLERQAREDPLTGLYNRRYFDAQLRRELAEARRFDYPVSVAICDLDHFKRINDTFSHAVGDEVLQVVARLFKAHFREVDTVARYGGEEFVLLLPQTSAQDAATACETFRQVVEAHPWDERHPGLRVTLSAGVADTLSTKTFKTLLAAADDNLYRAKREGRNRVVA